MLPHRLQPDTSLSDNLAFINQNFDILDDQDRTKIINNGTTPKLLFGYQDGGFEGEDYGIKIAKEGYDVTTATNDQLVFSSAFNVFKVVHTDTFTLPALDAAGGPADTSTTVIATGITSTSTPAFQAFVANDSGGYNSFPLIAINYSGNYQLYRTAAVELSGSDVQLRIYSQNFTGSPTVARTGRYYLYQETAD